MIYLYLSKLDTCLLAHKSEVEVNHHMLLEKVQDNFLELLCGNVFKVICHKL